MVWESGPGSFFCVSLSSFPSITCWRDCLYSIGYSFLLCQRWVGHTFVGPFLGSLLTFLFLSSVRICSSTKLSTGSPWMFLRVAFNLSEQVHGNLWSRAKKAWLEKWHPSEDPAWHPVSSKVSSFQFCGHLNHPLCCWSFRGWSCSSLQQVWSFSSSSTFLLSVHRSVLTGLHIVLPSSPEHCLCSPSSLVPWSTNFGCLGPPEPQSLSPQLNKSLKVCMDFPSLDCCSEAASRE